MSKANGVDGKRYVSRSVWWLQTTSTLSQGDAVNLYDAVVKFQKKHPQKTVREYINIIMNMSAQLGMHPGGVLHQLELIGSEKAKQPEQ